MRLTDEQRALVEANIGVAERAVSERVKRYGAKFTESYRESAYYALCLAAARPAPPGMTFEQFAFKRCHWQIIDDIRALQIQGGVKRARMRDRTYTKLVMTESDADNDYQRIDYKPDHHDWVAVADAKMDAEQFMDRLPVKVRRTMRGLFYDGNYTGRYRAETTYSKRAAAKYAGDAASRFYLFARNNLVRADGWRLRVGLVKDRFNSTAKHNGEKVTHTFISWWMKRHGFRVVCGNRYRYVVGLSWRFPNEQPASDRVVSGVRPVDSVVHRSGSADRPYNRRQAGDSCRTSPSPAAALAKPRIDQSGVGGPKGKMGRAPKRQRRRQDHARKLRRRRAVAGGKG